MGFFKSVSNAVNNVVESVQETAKSVNEKYVDTALDVATLGQRDLVNNMTGGKVDQIEGTLKLNTKDAAALGTDVLRAVLASGSGGAGAMNLSGIIGGSGLDLSKLGETFSGAANKLLNNAINKVTGGSENPVASATNQPQPVVQVVQGKNYLPYIIGGVVLLIGAMFFIFRKK